MDEKIDFSNVLKRNISEANDSAMAHVQIGREMALREVKDIIGTLSVHKPPMQIINELIALCRREK